MSIRTISLLAAALLIIAPIFGQPDSSRATEPPTPFRDIDRSIFAGDIAWLYRTGVTKGCASDAFCPDDFVTRGQFASFLARLFHLPGATRDYFDDDKGSTFERDINRVAAARVTRGCAEDRFCPTQNVTREQMASLLVRANDIDVRVRADFFWDDSTSEHERAINRLATAGLTQGCGAGRYCPAEAVTRGQMAAFLHRMMRAESPAPPTPAPNPPSPPTPTPTPRPSPTPSATVAPTTAPTTAPTAAPTVAPSAAPPSVPPAVGVAGYGAGAKGGAGGRVITVSNLNDSGSGSLRAAIEATGPRTVVFAVGGTISLGSDLRITDPFLTVDGSTAPKPVVVRGGMLLVSSHDVILRHLRFRPSDQVASPSDVDAVSLNGLQGETYNVVLDHLTMIWGPDIGGLSILGNVHDVTVQYSIMGEGLFLSRHPEAVASQDGHSMAANIVQMDAGVAWPERITFHHNLFTTSHSRMPRVQGAECVDLVNNVIYNWGQWAVSGNPRALNIVNNWFRAGPEMLTTNAYAWQKQADLPNPFPGSVYHAGNAADGFTYAVEAPSGVLRSSAACGGLSVNAESAQAAYNTVVGAAGATLPVRDAVDQRIITNVLNRSGSFLNGGDPYYP